MMRHILIYALFLSLSAPGFSAAFKTDAYPETELAKLKASPEEYKNKKVCYTSVYVGYYTTFRLYVERSGFKAGKYFWLRVVPLELPVMAKKDDEINELVSSLDTGAKIRAKVKVYGRVKQFTYEDRARTGPHYYLELDKIELVKDAVPDAKAEELIKTDIADSAKKADKDTKEDITDTIIALPKAPAK